MGYRHLANNPQGYGEWGIPTDNGNPLDNCTVLTGEEIKVLNSFPKANFFYVLQKIENTSSPVFLNISYDGEGYYYYVIDKCVWDIYHIDYFMDYPKHLEEIIAIYVPN